MNILPGIRNRADLDRVLAYLSASLEERDYSAISTFAPAEAEGRCVYCAHCHPCPKGLDIALINKYYDWTSPGGYLFIGHSESIGNNTRYTYVQPAIYQRRG